MYLRLELMIVAQTIERTRTAAPKGSHSGGGLGRVLIVVLMLSVTVGGVIAYVVTRQGDATTAPAGGSGPVTMGEGEEQALVPSDGYPGLRTCTVAVMATTRRCGDAKVVPLDAARMPFVSRNISLAWAAGKPGILTKNSVKESSNRAAACPDGWPRKYGELSQCDEYPFATTDQGGPGARTEEVPRRENSCQGGTLRWAYAKAQIADGDAFVVIILNPQSIATSPYAGIDTAKDKSTCL